MYYNNRLVIPAHDLLRHKLLSEVHDSLTGDMEAIWKHSNNSRQISIGLKWSKMSSLMYKHASFSTKISTRPWHRQPQPLPVPTAIWEDISLNFITHLPKSLGFDAILVVVDCCSKYNHFIVLSHPFTAKSMDSILYKEIIRLHRVPRSIISNRDTFSYCFWAGNFHTYSKTGLRMSITSIHRLTSKQR